MASVSWHQGDSYAPTVTLTVNQQSQNVADNYSTVSYSLVISRPSNISSTAAKAYSVKINGSTVASGTTTIGGTGSKTITSGTARVDHNADGTKSISFSFSLAVEITWGGTYLGTASGNGTMVLTTIPRATTPTLSASTADMGTSVTITMNRASSVFTHKLAYSFSNASGTIGTGLATSSTWTIPLTLASQIPNTTSGYCTITCTTYNGSTVIGSKTVGITLTVPSTVIPTIGGVTISEATPNIVTKFNAYVQNKSTLNVAITAAGAYGSTIAKYETYIQAIPYREASFVSNVITVSGTVGVLTTVTDSRGRTAQVSNSITVVAYTPPVISSMSAWRINTSGTASDDGDRIAVAMKFAISSVNNLNDHTYELKYKQSGASDFTTFSSDSASWSYDDTQSFTSAPVISPDNAYTIRLEISDYFTTVAYEFRVPTAFTLFDCRSTGKGIAFGKVSEKDAMEVAMNSEFTGQMKIFAPSSTAADSGFIRMYRADGTLAAFLATSDNADGLNLHFYSGGTWAGVIKFGKDGAIIGKNTVIEQGTSGIWTYRKWSDGTAECWGSRSIGNLASSAFAAWGSLVSATITAVDFPITFTAEPNLFSSLQSTGGALWLTCDTPSTTSTGIGYAIRPTATTVNGVKIKYYAIGKWK